ncbi:hypothetical protein NA56DRAFT_718646 [Hyaloscypha hepaticicola]|uniref:Uncharacterized protein n=1 Tax=Hyaloscypha hepaticicola TaxID=2082293 RepID=A0A2J6Q8M5_9HELO|nr:hypothetical protein NA56DRAFT_718646 [Hyaloscypha hepaticicola]
MQLSLIICMFSAATAFSATTSTRIASKAPIATAVGRVVVARGLKPASPPTATDVKISIVNWQSSVKTVNDYLPENKSKVASAIVFVKDELMQLATLMKITALSRTGVNAAKSIQNEAMTTQHATAAVNFNRSCTMLQQSERCELLAANQTKARAVSMPNLEA